MKKIPLSALTIVMYIDPAASRTKLKRQRANQAIVVVGAYEHWIFVLEAWHGQLAIEKLHDKIIETAILWHPTRIGCEANAMQVLFADDIMLVSKLKGVRLNIEPIYQPTNVEKPQRIRAGLQPIINIGRLILDPKRHADLIEQIVSHPGGRLVDLVDALESACRMLPMRSIEQQGSDVRAALKAFLEKSGTHPRVIERRLQQYDQQRGRQTLSNSVEAELTQGGGAQSSGPGGR